MFVTAGEKLGGCGDGIGCSDSKVYKCDQEDKNWDSDKTGLIGTCIPKSGYFSSVIFGSGTCRKGTKPCSIPLHETRLSMMMAYTMTSTHRITIFEQ